MAIPFLSDIDLNKKQALQLVLHNSTSDPAGGVEGQVYYNTDDNKLMAHNGTSFVTVGNTDNEVKVLAGAMVTGNTETGITVTYQSADNTIDFVVADSDFALTGDVTGTQTQTAKGNVSIATTIASDAVHHGMLNDDIISGQGALTSGLASTDELMISDAGTVKRMDVSVLQSYLQSNLTFTTNTDVNVNVANLTARLPQITESVTIGDATDVTVTTSGNLVVTGDLTVSGDTISANVATLNVEDKNITLNYSSSDSSSTANGSGITIQDAVDASTDATILWDASNDEFDFSHKINVTGGITGTILTASQTNITAIGTIATGTWAATDIAIAHGGTGASTASAAFDNLKQAATTSATGVVELATTTEASAGTDSSRAVTADGLQQFHNDRNKSFELDNSASGVASSDNITYTITHGMGASRLYKVEVIEDANNYETVYAEVQRPSDTTIKVIFGSAVTAGAYRALITKI